MFLLKFQPPQFDVVPLALQVNVDVRSAVADVSTAKNVALSFVVAEVVAFQISNSDIVPAITLPVLLSEIIPAFPALRYCKPVTPLDIVLVKIGSINVEKPESEYRPIDILVVLSLLIST